MSSLFFNMVRADREIGGMFGVTIGSKFPDGSMTVLCTLANPAYMTLSAGEAYSGPPTMRLDSIGAQVLVDALIDAGVKPTKAVREAVVVPEQTLAAMQAHINDLRMFAMRGYEDAAPNHSASMVNPLKLPRTADQPATESEF
jgi:uncharacterized protein (UPF0264 family)